MIVWVWSVENKVNGRTSLFQASAAPDPDGEQAFYGHNDPN